MDDDLKAAVDRLWIDAERYPLEERSPHQADLITVLSALRQRDEALEWYGEQARLARLIHSEGDAGRNALAADGGSKARAILTGSETNAR